MRPGEVSEGVYSVPMGQIPFVIRWQESFRTKDECYPPPVNPGIMIRYAADEDKLNLQLLIKTECVDHF